MRPERVLAIVQGGGKGSRMDVLTRERAKPAIPFAGIYQLVDFPMSNLRHSRVEDVWFSVQYQADSLEDEVANGRSWDLDRTGGGFRLLVPQEGGAPDAAGFATGNADELYRVRDQITFAAPDVVIVLSSDHVYRFDYRDAIETHLTKGAECTVVTTEVSLEEASAHATIVANRLGRVTDLAYKPEKPTTGVVATEIFVYDTAVLVHVLDELHREQTATAEPDPEGLGDFGDHLLPRLVERGKVYAHAMPGYWRDLGRPETYLAAHQDLTQAKTSLFNDPDWPIMARLPQRSPARIRTGSTFHDCLVSPGCDVSGDVRGSVLGPGVVVAEGASIVDSVIFADVTIGPDAVVWASIIDRYTTVEREAVVGEQSRHQPPRPEDITLVGQDCRIRAGSTLPRGSRLEPGTTT